MRVDIAGAVSRFQPGQVGAEVPRAAAAANDKRITTKNQVYGAIQRLVPGARVVATHAAIAPAEVRQNGTRTQVWRSNQTITIEAPLSKKGAVDQLRNNIACIDGVVNVSPSNSSVSPGRSRSTRNRAEIRAVQKLKKRAKREAPGATLTQLSLSAASTGTPRPFMEARAMGLESAAPAESHHGDKAISASVSGTWQHGGKPPKERKVTLTATATANPRPDLGGIVLSNRAEAPTKAAAVNAHNAKWARVNALVRQHLGKGFKTVGDSSMSAREAEHGRPASASQTWTINNVKLGNGGDHRLYALRQALAQENISVQLTSGISAGRFNAARSGAQKTVARRAAYRAKNALTAAGAALNSRQRDTSMPHVGNEDNLRASSNNRFDVPILVQANGTYGFGIASSSSRGNSAR
jgi:hypothetical protein